MIKRSSRSDTYLLDTVVAESYMLAKLEDLLKTKLEDMKHPLAKVM